MTKHGFELWLQKALKRISPVRYRLRYRGNDVGYSQVRYNYNSFDVVET